MRSRFRLVWSIVAVLALVMVAGTVIVRAWPPAYILYKRLKAESPYVYDEIRPDYLDIDPARRLAIVAPDNVAAMRNHLVAVIGDGWIDPDHPSGACGIIEVPADETATHDLDAIRALAPQNSLRAFRLDLGGAITAYAFHLRPPEANGQTVVVQYGFAGEFQDGAPNLEILLERGFSIIGLNLLAYGGNTAYFTADGVRKNLHHEVEEIVGGVFPHVAQVHLAISLAQALEPGQPVHLVGFSMGAFVVTLVAAIDPRPTVVSANSGIYPDYLRDRPQDEPIGIAADGRLLAVASHLDLMLLAAIGEGRHYMQVFNRYDRCCYSNVKGRLYEPALSGRVEELGLGGGFHVVVDETHARHMLSPLGAEALVDTIHAVASSGQAYDGAWPCGSHPRMDLDGG